MQKRKISKKEVDDIRNKMADKWQETQEELPFFTHERLCALNDGVIAIILTIMALEIHLPVDANSYSDFLIDVGIFLTSFFVVANFWYENHLSFATFKRATHKVIIYNFMFLAVLTLIPVLTKWIMLDLSRLAVMNYGVVYLLVVLLQSFIFGTAHKDLAKSENPFLIGLMRLRVVSMISFNLILIALSYFIPRVAMVLYIFLPIYSFLSRGKDKKLNGRKK